MGKTKDDFQHKMQIWLKTNFDTTPEQVNKLSDDEFDAFIIKLSMKECDAVNNDETEAMFIAHILDYFVDNRP